MALGRGLAETARLVAELNLNDNFSRGIGTALGSLGRFEGGLTRMSRGVGQVGSGLERLGTRAAIAGAAGVAAVVQTAASFEQAFTGIEKTVDATDAQFAELEGQFRQMARSIPVSFEELAAIGEAGGALGIARQDLLDFTDVVARLAVSTDLSSDQAATALGQLGNVLHLSGGEFRDFADSLVALGNAGASTESQIVGMAARFGAAGNSAGLSKEEILALSSAVASMGIEVEAGGSALSRIFNSVATNIGTSSDKAVAFADTLGLSAKEFRQAWERDALGTFQEFLTELGKLDQFEQASVLKSIGITNTRDVNTVRLMGQNVKFVGEQLVIAREAQGSLNEESQKFFDTASGQFKTLQNNLRDAGVTIGNELLPIFKELTQEFTKFLDRPGTREALRSFGQDLAKGIRSVIDELKKADFSGLIEGMKTAAQVAKTAFDLFHSLPPQVQALAITAIAANKVSGGAVGQIAKGLGNIFAGALQTVLPRFGGKVGGLLGGPGSSPFNPLFVSVVGPGGLGGGLLGGARGGIPFGTNTFGGGGIGLGVGGGALAALIGLPIAQGIGEGVARFLTGHDPFAPTGTKVLGAPIPKTGVPGGAPVPVKLVEGSGADNAAALGIREMHKGIVAALGRGDIKEAVRLKELSDAMRGLRGAVDKRVNDIIPHLGRTNRALSVANRNLDDGNARQRQMDQHIEQARRAIGTGFRETDNGIRDTARTTHAHLSRVEAQERATAGNTREIASKDFSPDVNVTVPVTTNVSVSDVFRAASTYNVATSLSSQTRSGFKP